jgi:hypothetical protein
MKYLKDTKFKEALINHLKGDDMFQHNCLKENVEEKDNGDDQWIMFVSFREFEAYNKDLKNEYFVPYILRNDPYYKTLDNNYKQEADKLYNDFMEEGTPTHVVRFVTRNQFWSVENIPLQLVDGTQYYIIYNEEDNSITSIWEEAWNGSQPDYYGGPIDEAKLWCEECGEVIYTQLNNPFLEKQGTVDNGGYPSFVDRNDIEVI